MTSSTGPGRDLVRVLRGPAHPGGPDELASAIGLRPLALAPMALLLPAALFQGLRPAVLVVSVAAVVLLVRRGDPAAWAWAAVLPVLAIYTWGLTVTAALAQPGLRDCTNPLSPPALWRFLETATVVALTIVLAARLGASRSSLSLRLPDRRRIALALAACVGTAVVTVQYGATVATGFYGPLRLADGLQWAMLPALVFAGSNSLLEELCYRGVLLGWTRRVYGVAPAIVLQAAAFGLAHAGPDFVSSPLPVVVATACLGAIGGIITVRSGSLLLPIAVHLAFDVPLYFFTACRVA